MIEEKVRLDQVINGMHANVYQWDNTIDNGIAVLEKNYDLMLDLVRFNGCTYNKRQQKMLKEIFKKIKEISTCIVVEKTKTMEQIKQTNQSNKIANQYVNGFSDSYFIDKDF